MHGDKSLEPDISQTRVRRDTARGTQSEPATYRPRTGGRRAGKVRYRSGDRADERGSHGRSLPLPALRCRSRQRELGRSSSLPQKKLSIRIDGELISALEGQSILQAAKANGKFIPTLCDLEGLTPVGACRICIVEVSGTDRLLPACTTPIQDGMSV
ncbi:MAG: hypothetical protein DMG68_22225, partial [Acidobacteria bacterium]